MNLNEALGALTTFAPQDFSRLEEALPREWIVQALEASGTASIRTRRIPAELVVWLVIGMCLLRRHSVDEVVNLLDLKLPNDDRPVARSSIHQAKDRLGAEPLRMLFAMLAHKWAHEAARQDPWNGLAVYALDGTLQAVPDSPQNREHFGKWRNQHSDSSYPQMRLVALMAARSHLIAAAAFGPCSIGEQAYASELWSHLPANSVTLMDRNFSDRWPLATLRFSSPAERYWVMRKRKDVSTTKLKRLRNGDWLVEISLECARRDDPSLPSTMMVREIQYKFGNNKTQALLTSLLDPVRFPRSEVIALYHERWEFELGADEVKTEVLGGEMYRSRSPERIDQEVWGLLILYNLIRYAAARIAKEVGVAPTRISFVGVLAMVLQTFISCACTMEHGTPGNIPKFTAAGFARLKRMILPERRSNRVYERKVKKRATAYETLGSRRKNNRQSLAMTT